MKKLEIKLLKSTNSCKEKHVKTVRSLGLTKINQVVILDNIPSVLGKLKQVWYLLEVREV